MSPSIKPSRILPKSFGSNGISAIIILLTIICIFTPSVLFLRQLTDYTFYIMIAWVAIGFLAFLIKKERIMMVSLFCCCVLCLHLKGSANKQMRFSAISSNASLKISHINLGNAENDYDKVIDYLLHLNVDFISFQELTPDWNMKLAQKLAVKYPYVSTMTRLDQYGLGFFSRLPFHHVDTIFFHEVPSLIASIQLDQEHICNIVSCTVVPPVNQAAFRMIADHFGFLTDHMRKYEGDVILLGDLHLPPWSSEIQQFKLAANLQDSRRDTNPRNVDGSLSLPRIPVEHIFFGQKFECTSFSELGNSVVGRLGITGTYQIFNRDAESNQ